VAAAMKASVQSDALVFFGATGDLAHKKVLPALYALVKAGSLRVPVIGVGRTTWTLSQFRQRVKSAITDAGGVDDSKAFERLMAQLRYVQGDSSDEATFAALKLALDGIRHPAFYLATPPALFAGVIKHLAAAGLAKHARLIIEKPFGNDLASARAPEPGRESGVPRRLDLPDRSLPRQGAGREHPVHAIRQLVPRANLELRSHRERADHAR